MEDYFTPPEKPISTQIMQKVQKIYACLQKKQKLINSHPKQAKKDFFIRHFAQSQSSLKDQHDRQGDPDTSTFATDPGKVIEEYCADALKPVNIKTGKYLSQKSLRCHS